MPKQEPDFFLSPDPGSNNSYKGGGGNLVLYLFCSHKYHKIENDFIIEQVQKKNMSQFSHKELYCFLSKILSLSSQKSGFWSRDLRSEIR
jgi:hypothetical protein